MTDGAHLVVDALRLNGVSAIYGVVGIPITDVARLAQASGIRFLGFRHESAAGHAAAAAGFLTGRPGVCMTVSGPGFLNGLVALANATTNCFPMIQIAGSGDRAVVDLGRGDYEELDQYAVARSLAKAAYRVDRPADIGLAVARAIRTATSGRPGGVYLDIPAAVLAEVVDDEIGAASLRCVVDPAPRQLPAPDAVERAVTLLAGARRPLIVLGKGAAYARADDAIRRFVETTGIPYLPMSMAKGLLPDDHPQSVAAARSLAMRQADVVMLVGARLNWLLGHGEAPQWNPDAQFIQVEIDPSELDSNQPIAAPLLGDVGSVMDALNRHPATPGIAAPPPWRGLLHAKVVENKVKMAARLVADTGTGPMGFYPALRAVRDVLSHHRLSHHREVYLVNEGANTLDLTRNVVDMYVPRHRLDSGTWGVMGVGLGYAIAAAVETGAPVVAIEGDSAFGFSGMEMETICRYRLPVTVVVFNNGGIYRGDDANPVTDDPAPTRLLQSTRYHRLAESFGADGYFVTTPNELEAALQTAITSGRPALLDCLIDPADGTESGHLTNLNPTVVKEPA
ncbi:oxalyl-CoA decarboxylase [Mycolicibacterium parafortuitum]|uniref:Putative oxalyl-CoA decarboxylase [Providencia stuartii MRSN 2154] n=1 Tax=Mycolicibacterium parafortuitum TaxID=39692 RepID=A0A375YD27_MYCPF|nr:oxalyl-CoA decarboxylase [Mycolicibacterium parafortuitum]ORB30976.1 oxalyl-CoA decarboxylase [Mycolicibacterium parafortuitum]SRX78979.1 putative oxalyl-CoA decarboxylase [Providencia stuartii MRSN 2154] [Mycolicibacterium parafortuitum]